MEVIFVTDQSPEQACMTYYNISNGVILKNFKNSSCARHGFGFIGNDLLLATQHNKQLINVYETSKVRTGYFIRINYQHINLLPRGRFLFCKDFSVQSEQYGHQCRICVKLTIKTRTTSMTLLVFLLLTLNLFLTLLYCFCFLL